MSATPCVSPCVVKKNCNSNVVETKQKLSQHSQNLNISFTLSGQTWAIFECIQRFKKIIIFRSIKVDMGQRIIFTKIFYALL